MKDPDEIFYHIDALLRKSGKKEKDLIDYLGLSKGTYSRWKMGGHGRSYHQYIKEICAFFHVTPTELVLGEDRIEDEKKRPIITDEECEIIENYRKMGLKERGYMKKFMTMLLES